VCPTSARVEPLQHAGPAKGSALDIPPEPSAGPGIFCRALRGSCRYVVRRNEHEIRVSTRIAVQGGFICAPFYLRVRWAALSWRRTISRWKQSKHNVAERSAPSPSLNP
jgi:hypothetical protein